LNDDRAGRTVYFLRIKIFVVVDFFFNFNHLSYLKRS
jgi:hypothetical protein